MKLIIFYMSIILIFSGCINRKLYDTEKNKIETFIYYNEKTINFTRLKKTEYPQVAISLFDSVGIKIQKRLYTYWVKEKNKIYIFDKSKMRKTKAIICDTSWKVIKIGDISHGVDY